MRRAVWALSLLAFAVPAAAAEKPVLRLYLARHGQTEWNALKKLQGRSDIPLNAVGREQAKALVARLDGVALERIYTSSLVRTRMTAEAFGGRVPVEPLAGLDEQSLGAFEGAEVDGPRWAEMQRRHADPNDAMDGGESRQQHYARVRQAVTDLRARHEGKGGTVLVIGHGGTNALILRALLDLTDAQAETIKQANDEVYLVELGAGAPRVMKLIALDRLTDL
jgi:2,3-bisphosphoglycerate-dependent phosphoglycerate mutase